MKRVFTSAKIDLGGLNFFDADDAWIALLTKGLTAQVTETLREVFEETPPQLELPIAWGPDDDGCNGPCPTDPVMLYVSLPLGRTQDENVNFACSLEGAIDRLIELHENPDGNVFNPGSQEICGQVAARLRELADKLDKACGKVEAADD